MNDPDLDIRVNGYRCTHPAILELARNDGTGRAIEVIVRDRARKLISDVERELGAIDDGWSPPPYDPLLVANTLGIRCRASDSPDLKDAMILVDREGPCILYRSRRSKVRTRFSIFHEIAHTLFPGFENHILHRDPGRSAPFDPEAQLESLCDLAASEMLLPETPFTEDLERGFSVRRIPSLSRRYGASMEAVCLRMVQLIEQPYLILKLNYRKKRKKPRTKKIVPDGVPDAHKNMRVAYSARSPAFGAESVSRYLAVPSESCIHLAAWGGKPTQSDEVLNLGSGHRAYHVEVLPLRGSSQQPYRPVLALISPPDANPA